MSGKSDLDWRRGNKIHHWTLNHEEDGETQILSSKEHGKIHGLTNTIANEMSIRREIIYELTKVISPKRLIDVLENVVDELKDKKYLGNGRRFRNDGKLVG